MDEASPQPPSAIYNARRRDKPQLSCTLCRRRKLKCDRGLPCQSCIRRGLSLSCTYVRSSAPEGVERSQARPTIPVNLQDRIGQLERLVTSLITTANNPVPNDKETREPVQATSPSSAPQEPIERSQPKAPSRFSDSLGRISLESTETRYTESIHWTAILDGITELKDSFQDRQSVTEPQEFPGEGRESDELDMVFGRYKLTNKHEILATLPPRSTVDRLVAAYFNKRNITPAVIHSSTFLKEYERFWEQPLETSFMWIGLLFTVMSLATIYDNRAIPLHSDPKLLVPAFREKIIQCLLLGQYAKCGPYTMETILLYFHVVYLRNEDAQIEIWILLGVIIRLALRIGYHRDPSNFPHISPFQGEMRRRIWSIITLWDALTSAEFGLPRMIRETHADTKEPSNLLDEDFDEDIAVLPTPRSNDFSSPIQYSVARNKIAAVFGQISDLITATTLPPYAEVMLLNQLLNNTYASLPHGLLIRPMAKSLMDTPEIIMRRFYIALMTQKAKCVLHYRYMLPARTDTRYAPSRSICIEAALQLLEYQCILYQETQPGGRLYQHSISFFIKTSFYLATTLLSLELNNDITAETEASAEYPDAANLALRQRVVQALHESYLIWIQSSFSSPEARKAAAVLSVVLGKVQSMGTRGFEQAPRVDDTPNVGGGSSNSPADSDFEIPEAPLPNSPPQRNPRAPRHKHHLADLGMDIDYSDIATGTDPLDLAKSLDEILEMSFHLPKPTVVFPGSYLFS